MNNTGLRDTGRPAPRIREADLLRFAQIIEQRFGLHFPEKRRDDLERGLRQAFAASTCQDLDEYRRLLQDPEAGGLELDRLINALTVGETYFFRDAGQFDALYNRVLPEILERRRLVRTVRLWSAGCASGEEPYSLAIMLRELLPDVDEWSITILGSDINAEALDRARKASYGEWAFREERARRWRARYFRRQGDRWLLDPRVQRMVTFSRLNLAGSDYPAFETNTTLMDVILCRNVTIYFSPGATRRVVAQLYDALVDGGWLVVGHAEPAPTAYQQFEARPFPHAMLYQRIGQTARMAAKPQPPAFALASTRRPSPGSAKSDRDQDRSQPAAPARDPAPRPAHDPTILDRDPSTAADPLLQAREFLEYGYSERARDLLLPLVTSPPEPAQACALLGQASANLGHWAEAERWCRRAVERDRLALEAYYTLALVLQHQGRIDEAIAAMKKVVYIDRHYVLGHFGLADLYHSRHDWAPAQKALDNARRLLEAQPAHQVVPGSGGITAERLYQTIIRQQQQWRPKIHDRQR